MKRILASGLLLAGVVGLSACGAGGGDFASRLTAVCVKERGEADRKDCACATRVIDESLSTEDRQLAMLSMDADEGRFKTRDDARKAMSAIGISPNNAEEIMGGFVVRMMTIEAKASATCNVS